MRGPIYLEGIDSHHYRYSRKRKNGRAQSLPESCRGLDKHVQCVYEFLGLPVVVAIREENINGW
jgi:hypothetical protein